MILELQKVRETLISDLSVIELSKKINFGQIDLTFKIQNGKLVHSDIIYKESKRINN